MGTRISHQGNGIPRLNRPPTPQSWGSSTVSSQDWGVARFPPGLGRITLSPQGWGDKVILPLAVPGMAVTALWGFLTGWSEFILSWTFLVDPERFTLPMVLRGMTGEYAAGTPWSQFAAIAILMSIPPMLIFFFLQRYLVSGLAVGGVKG